MSADLVQFHQVGVHHRPAAPAAKLRPAIGRAGSIPSTDQLSRPEHFVVPEHIALGMGASAINQVRQAHRLHRLTVIEHPHTRPRFLFETPDQPAA